MLLAAAFGFKLHTGWAALVAISGGQGKIQLHLRQRVELLPTDDSIPRFVYHKASELPLTQASTLVKRAEDASVRTAREALKEALRNLEAGGVKVKICGILSGSTLIPEDLSAILRSHPLIHAAEGALFQNAIVSACKCCGLETVLAREREVWTRAAATCNSPEARLRKEVDALRKTAGSPWSSDQKAATAVALLALETVAA